MPTWKNLDATQRAKLAEVAKVNYDLICQNNANFKRSISEKVFVEYVQDAYKKHGDTREAAEKYHEKAIDKNPPGGKKTDDCYRVMQHFSGLSMTAFYMWLDGEV